MNIEFQRIARRDKKAFLSDQCKEIEENNIIGKTRDLFKKIRDAKGKISCKDGLNKGQKLYVPSITMNKASECDEISLELFQILKDDAVKVLHSICQQIWKTQQWPQNWKRSVFIPIPKKGNVKESSNYCTIVLISHAGKIMLKILQDRLQ